MNKRKRKYGLQTRLTHGTQETNETTAVSPPIFQTSTFILRTPEEGAELATQIEPTAYYTRYGSPNTKQVEEMLTSLEESEAALAVGSGMAAITTALLANLQTGDRTCAYMGRYFILLRHGCYVEDCRPMLCAWRPTIRTRLP
jgi:methionine-gamma-lyase